MMTGMAMPGNQSGMARKTTSSCSYPAGSCRQVWLINRWLSADATSIRPPAGEPPKNGVSPYPKPCEGYRDRGTGASAPCRPESLEFRLHPDRTCLPGPRAGSPVAAPQEAGLDLGKLGNLPHVNTFLVDDWCFSARERCSQAHCRCQMPGPARRVHAHACLPRAAQ